ncbi:DUF1361 domain-containing protein [Flavobacterium sp. DG1-102-2]|uniref:DUF1361 domain-containing protein n=1 Tax=Flavobacterium sp. DG1-102-2 TaxID=3081663 RepID=UPI002948FDAF|nr:DUF1361 domain-containing protein [Flavobacterium sp. DG1-102-2]MDV6168151.1 DUF1361 domain-containing protein [Flavobacterium sp. DG1-102-2]
MIQTTASRIFSRHYILFALAAFCIALLLVRSKITHSIFFFFLIWNLFLAYTPLGLTSMLYSNLKITNTWYLYLPVLFCWLLLLPNAPYIITDFMHLKRETGVPVWFDVLLIASFSITGMLFGLASMKDMFRLFVYRFGNNTAWFIMAGVCLLCGFGMYVGRFLRYNSWDILQKPYTMTIDILCSLTNAETCKPAWGITIGFGTLMFLLFNLYHTPKPKKICKNTLNFKVKI